MHPQKPDASIIFMIKEHARGNGTKGREMIRKALAGAHYYPEALPRVKVSCSWSALLVCAHIAHCTALYTCTRAA